jgi:hypothetical protein
MKQTKAIKLINYVEDAFKRKHGRLPNAAEYIAANGLNPEDYEGEYIADAPPRLRAAIERLADKARREAEEDASRDVAQRAQQRVEQRAERRVQLRGLKPQPQKSGYLN